MVKKIWVILVMGLFVLGGSGVSFAAAAETASSSEKAVNVGNKICPVSGEKINEKFKATYEYKGKIYNFCCAMCIDAFKSDPEKYIKKVEEELQSKSKKETGEKSEAPGHMMHEGMH
jgi:YHS domain-containing protein